MLLFWAVCNCRKTNFSVAQGKKKQTSVLEIFQSSKLAIGFFWETEILEQSWVERRRAGSECSGMDLAPPEAWESGRGHLLGLVSLRKTAVESPA